jgi:hypothetical protein
MRKEKDLLVAYTRSGTGVEMDDSFWTIIGFLVLGVIVVAAIVAIVQTGNFLGVLFAALLLIFILAKIGGQR